MYEQYLNKLAKHSGDWVLTWWGKSLIESVVLALIILGLTFAFSDWAGFQGSPFANAVLLGVAYGTIRSIIAYTNTSTD